jgi:hypothetical protein
MSEIDLDDVAVIDDARTEETGGLGLPYIIRSPLVKARSLSDGGGTPKLSPSPHIFEASRRHSKDDSTIRDTASAAPSTPIRPGISLRGLSLQMPAREAFVSPAQQSPHPKPAPVSPKLDHPHTYASPTNILPRRSRGLDFSRAATSLHHSTLADQASPDSSPTIGSRAMNIPGNRRSGEYGTAEQTSTSLWSMMGNHERTTISSSLGSNMQLGSDTSSSSEEDYFMDEDMDEAFITTPQVNKIGMPSVSSSSAGTPWMPTASPAGTGLMSFQQRQRRQRQQKKKLRGPASLGLSVSMPQPVVSRSPPSNNMPKEIAHAHSRRESISWAANQLHISGSESDDNLKTQLENVDSPSRPGVIKRAVTRRGNLLVSLSGAHTR